MIDIHSHMLFGLDDGSPNVDVSLSMAEQCVVEGITHVVCTPHANDTHAFQPELSRQRLEQLQARLGDRITLGLGCDFHLSYDNILDALKNPTKYTINGLDYLLVEFPDYGISPNMGDTFYRLQVAGMLPIITHPERNPTIVQHPERLAEWMRGGCLVQVTAGSITGRFGKAADKFGKELLRRNWVHFIATDAHNVTARPPKIREAYQYIVDNFGAETAKRLCVTNPQAAFFGEKFPQQPEAVGLYDENPWQHDSQSSAKGGLLGRLFSW
jgi:protein-tyrosine phosphatase